MIGKGGISECVYEFFWIVVCEGEDELVWSEKI